MAKNVATPLATQLFNRALDAAFALVALRVLGPAGAGKYAFAGVLVLYLEIAAGFGLETLITRDIARDLANGPRYLWHALLLRTIFWVALTPVLAVGLLVWDRLAPLGDDTLAATALLIVAALPALWAGAVSRLFYAHERMATPALVTVQTTLLKVGLGLAALAAGFGIVGLAAVAIVNNAVTVATLAFLARSLITPVRPAFQPRLAWRMLVEALPLCCNNVLAAAFFRADVLLLQAWQGPAVVGWYTAAYKVIDAALLIPSSLTLALFPAMARQATGLGAALERTYHLAVRYLLVAAFPLAAGATLLAVPIAALVGGRAFLPHSAIALQWLIWFLPLSYVNGVTQYVLLALGRQRSVTAGFLVVTVFNIAANTLAIPLLSYQGAALVTVLSEIVLLLAFLLALRGQVALPPLPGLAWRPVAAAFCMSAVLLPFREGPALLLAILGAAVFAAAYLALGGWTADDRRIIRALLRR